MTGRQILERIVKEKGSCDFADADICAACPMSRLVKSDGSDEYLSCVEALGVHLFESSHDINKAYKEKAERLILEIDIEEVLKS